MNDNFYPFVVDSDCVTVEDDKLVFKDENLKVTWVIKRESIDSACIFQSEESAEIAIMTRTGQEFRMILNPDEDTNNAMGVFRSDR